MTTEQNTVFSQVAVKAPEIVVAPARCEVGARLVHEWAMAVKAERDREKSLVLFFSWGSYQPHLATCLQCQEYEKSRRAKK